MRVEPELPDGDALAPIQVGRIGATPLPWLGAIAVVCLALLSAGGHSHGASECVVTTCRMAMPGAASPIHILASAALEWLLMIGAMMPPLLVLPVSHLMASTFRRHRAGALFLFAAGYLAPWMAAGLVFVPVERGAAAALGWAAFPIITVIAFCWSASPVAQRARNRCDQLRPIRPVGFARQRDCFMQGAISGMSCVLACWPWMILPMVATVDHSLATAIATMLVILDRFGSVPRPRWQWPPAVVFLALRPIGRLRRPVSSTRRCRTNVGKQVSHGIVRRKINLIRGR
jgi:predicted metal-binding membrane protein